ncbi:MFS transporter [Bacteroides uniformis]|uniref:MFS transporter n=1 Tax=Bacteroides uniformis TaxID=820 RepID=UPI000EEC512F|nr:MFS transporter [Bacteroides uniformis]MDC1997374.1 MFS transporter [Bacteroides uniformis]MDC2000502.1 MFS transporter [Bacteroides uniformis]MDC2004048.1 MFS transporter [Bacteroides uniformis]HCR01184.1 MFS transporter [Bacteroides uniformis]
MRKNSTNKLMTLNFWRMCTANLLLFISVYMLFPLLPFVMGEQLGVSVGQAGSMFLVFVVAMFAVGPFHAYLVDEYKRKHVLLYSALIMLAAVLGYAFVDGYTKFLLLAAVQGACFGLATTAGITVAIDITTSARRSAGNMVYAWAARLGMLVGVVLGIGMYRMYGFRMVTYLSVAAGLASIFFASRVYVAFRAPIGVSLCNMDRFLLPRAWVPAINMLLIAFVPGALLPLMFVGDYWSLAALAVLVFITVPFMKMFVKLSHHCQRGTANTTCHLSMEAGLLVGMTVACHLMDKAQIYHVASVAAMLAVFFFVLLTYPYYKKKRVR